MFGVSLTQLEDFSKHTTLELDAFGLVVFLEIKETIFERRGLQFLSYLFPPQNLGTIQITWILYQLLRVLFSEEASSRSAGANG